MSVAIISTAREIHMSRFFPAFIVLILASTIFLASCSDPRTEAGPQPDEECELERKRVSSIDTDTGIVLAKFGGARGGGFSAGRSSSFGRSSSYGRSTTTRPSVRPSAPVIVPYTSGSSKENQKPKYKWVWDCD